MWKPFTPTNGVNGAIGNFAASPLSSNTQQRFITTRMIASGATGHFALPTAFNNTHKPLTPICAIPAPDHFTRPLLSSNTRPQSIIQPLTASSATGHFVPPTPLNNTHETLTLIGVTTAPDRFVRPLVFINIQQQFIMTPLTASSAIGHFALPMPLNNTQETLTLTGAVRATGISPAPMA